MNILKIPVYFTLLAQVSFVSLELASNNLWAHTGPTQGEVDTRNPTRQPPHISQLDGFSIDTYRRMHPEQKDNIAEHVCQSLVAPQGRIDFWCQMDTDLLPYDLNIRAIAHQNPHLEQIFLEMHFPEGVHNQPGFTYGTYAAFFAEWVQDIVNATTRPHSPLILDQPINWDFQGVDDNAPWIRHFIEDEAARAPAATGQQKSQESPGNEDVQNCVALTQTGNPTDRTPFVSKRINTVTTEEQYRHVEDFRDSIKEILSVPPINFRIGENAYTNLAETGLGHIQHVPAATKHLTTGDGWCGFHALGISPEEFVRYCLDLVRGDDSLSIQRVYSHIRKDVRDVCQRLEQEGNWDLRRFYFGEASIEEFMGRFEYTGPRLLDPKYDSPIHINVAAVERYLRQRYTGPERWEGGMLEGNCVELVAEAAGVNYIFISDQPRQGTLKESFLHACRGILQHKDTRRNDFRYLREWVIQEAIDLRHNCVHMTSQSARNSMRFAFEDEERANRTLHQIFEVNNAQGLVDFNGLNRESGHREFNKAFREFFLANDERVTLFIENRIGANDLDWYVEAISNGKRRPNEDADWLRCDFLPLPNTQHFQYANRFNQALKRNELQVTNHPRRSIRTGPQRPDRKTVWLYLSPGHYSSLIPVITPEYCHARFGSESAITPFAALCADYNVDTYYYQTCLEELGTLARRGRWGVPQIKEWQAALNYARHLQDVYHRNVPESLDQYAPEIQAALYLHLEDVPTDIEALLSYKERLLSTMRTQALALKAAELGLTGPELEKNLTLLNLDYLNYQ